MANVDITALSIQVESRGITEATANLKALSEASATVESKTSSMAGAFGGLSSSQAAQVANIEKLLQKQQKQSDLYGATTSQINAYNLAEKGANDIQKLKGDILGRAVEAQKAQTAAEKEALSVKQKLNTIEVAAAKEAEDFVRSLKRQADQVGMTHKQIKEYNAELMRTKAASLGVTEQTEAHITAIKNSKGPHESFNLLTAGSARELMVLGHELSQGSFQRFGGSMIVLAERVNFLPSLLEKAAESAAALGVGLGTLVVGVLATVAGVALLVLAFFKGASEQRAFNNALTLTGNYAGTTGAALDELAHAAVATGGSVGEAKKAVLELANSGKFTADQIEKITRAAVDMEHATGKSVTSTVKEFEELATLSISSTSRSTDAISQHVMKLNDHYHFLTATQFNEISMLEKLGETQAAANKAEEFYADAMELRSKKVISELGYISTAWHWVKESAGSAWDAMLNLGRTDDPITALKKNIADYKAMVATMDNRPHWISGQGQGGGAQAQFDQGRLRLVEALTAAQIELAKAETKAAEAGGKAQLEQDQIHSQARERMIREQYDRHQKAARELKEFDRDWEASTQEYKTQNLAGHLLAREAMIKRSHEAVAKIKGIGLSGLDEANKEIESVLEVEQRGYDNSIRLIEMKRKYKQVDETNAATQKDTILNEEYSKITAYYEKEIANAANFHSKDVRLMNDAASKKFVLMEKLGKFQSDMQLRMDENNSKEIKAANESEIAAQQAYDAQSKTLEKEINNLQDKHAAYAMLPAAIRAVGVTEKQMQDLVTQGAIDRLEASKLEDTLGAAELKRINDLIKKLKEKRDLQALVEVDQKVNTDALGMPAKLKAQAAEAANLWKESAAGIESALTSAFDNAGKAAGTMFKVFAEGQARQIELSEKITEAQRRQASSGVSEAELLTKLQDARVSTSLKSYGDMAEAGKHYFKEGSKGYQVLATAEKAFRAYEMLMAIKSVVVKSGLLTAFTGLFVTQKAVQVGVEGAATTASVGMAGTQASAWGITAVVKAMASLPFPFNLAAGAITLAAVLAIGAKMAGSAGGGSVSVSEQRQQSQGTGSVLGDANAKSESISHSLTIMEKNSGLGLVQGNSMVNYLRIVSESIQGLAGIVVGRTSSITTGPAITNSSNIFAKLGNSIFGGKKTLEDTGISASAASLASIMSNGVKANQYADVKTGGGWFSSDKHSTDLSALSKEANDQFTLVITNMAKSIQSAAGPLGLSGDVFNKKLASFVVDIGKISLKGMTGDEVQKALEAVFSKLGDDMARFAIAGLDKFQKVGEGYLETVVRISNDMMQVRDVFAVLDKSFALTGISAVNVSESLISVAGSLETLTQNTKYYVDNFLTEAEKMGPVTKSLASRLVELNLGDVTSIDLFNKKIRALDLTNVADQKLYVAMLELAPAFKEVTDYTDKLAEGTVELTKAQKAALDVVNKARSNLEDAYKSESSALQSTIDKTKAYSQTLKDFQNSLKLGANSPLTNQEKYAEARKQFDAVAIAAKAGDAAAQQKFTGIATEFLNASKVINASGQAYTTDFNLVQDMTGSLVDAALNQVDVATASLTALNEQVAGLIQIDKSVMTVTQAITELRAAIEAGKTAGLTNTAMGVADPVVTTTNPATNTNVLVAAIASLKAQLAANAAAASAQTGALVGTLVDTTETSTGAIVTAVEKSVGSGGGGRTVNRYINLV